MFNVKVGYTCFIKNCEVFNEGRKQAREKRNFALN